MGVADQCRHHRNGNAVSSIECTEIHPVGASTQYINRISGAILVLAGAFIIWFRTTEITSSAAALGESAAFRAIERTQSTILNFIADRTVLIGAVFAGVITIAALYAFASRSPLPRDIDDDPPESRDGQGDLLDVGAAAD